MMRASPALQSRFGLRRVYALGCAIYATGLPAVGPHLQPDDRVLPHDLRGDGVQPAVHDAASSSSDGCCPSSLYSTGNSVAQMVAFGLGPILGAGLGGFVYQHAGPVVLYSGASALALGGAAVAWFALRGPRAGPPDHAGR